MILHDITLTAWRSYLNETQIQGFSDRINVISGPNGIGKSTMFEALRCALMDNHAVTGQEIASVRPWGRDLSPKVSVIFSHDGIRYRIIKQFMESGYSRLEREENGLFQPLAERRQADDRVREMLTRAKPGRGLSQSKNWGLAQVLWAPQGEIKLEDLSGDLASDIRSAIMVQITDKAAESIEAKIAEKYLQFYTPKGSVKSGKNAPPSEQFRKELEKVKQAVEKAEAQFTRYKESSECVETAGLQYRQKRKEADECEKSLQGAREREDRYRELKIEETRRKDVLDKTGAQYRQIQQHIEFIRSAEKELGDLQTELARMETKVPLKLEEMKTSEQTADAARKTLIEIRNSSAAVGQAEADAKSAHRYQEVKALHMELARRIERLNALKQTIETHQKQRMSMVAPDKQTIKTMQTDLQEQEIARLRLDASLIHLEIIPETDGILEVIKGDRSKPQVMSKSCPVVVKGSPEVIADIKGVARVRARGPEGDVKKHHQIIEEKQVKIQENARPFGTTDIKRLEAMVEAAEDLDRKIKDVQKEYDILSGGHHPDGLAAEFDRMDLEITGFEKKYPEWKEAAPDADALKQTAQTMKQDYEEKNKDAEKNWDQAQSMFSTAREQYEIAGNRLKDLKSSLGKIQTRLDMLTDDGKSPADRENELKRIILEQDAGQASLKEIRENLSVFKDDPSVTLKKLEKDMADLLKTVQQKRDEERTAMGNLEVLAAQGTYSVLAEAKEEAARLADDIHREEMRMNAVSLLHTTVCDCRAEAAASVARPVEDAATALLQRIAGHGISRIELGDSFKPSCIRPGIADTQVDLVNLSGGEQEQLYLAARLSLAEILAGSERQMVVLDDVLTATDTGRLEKILAILEEYADRLQIIILTCHPERYQAFKDARFFDLAALIDQSQHVN